jgi:hypothetical protein
MRHYLISTAGYKIVIVSVTLILFSYLSKAQDVRLGFHADPVISWFSSDIKEVINKGARPGFNFGLTLNKYFTPNYSFSTGLNLLNAGGRTVSTDTVIMQFANFNSEVLPGDPVVYKIQYLSIPLGLKMQTNEIGYVSFFTDIGLDPKIVVGGKADIPSLDITGENASGELKLFNLSYHISAGIDYSIGGTNALVLALSFDNNFFDITKDVGNQRNDKISHKILSFRIGIIF